MTTLSILDFRQNARNGQFQIYRALKEANYPTQQDPLKLAELLLTFQYGPQQAAVYLHLGGVYDRDLHSFLYFTDSDVFWKGCVADLAYWKHLPFYLMFKGFFIHLYATSIVSTLVKKILARCPMAFIHVLSDNPPAIHVYEKVGFKPYRTYLFVRGEKR